MKLSSILLAVVLFAAVGFAQDRPEAVRVDANPSSGFSYPYYLIVPKSMRSSGRKPFKHSILVLPNNTGKFSDDLSFHEADVKRRIKQNAPFAETLRTVILLPVFPRPESDWNIYTHALDRDTMLTDKKAFARLDLQLVSMIDDARSQLEKDGLKLDKKVLMLGFSASAMFVNRFTFLHPERVKAAAIGSPGGWPIAPAAVYKEKALRYPIGIGDFKQVSGSSIDLKALRRVPLFFFLGDKDDNDSVPFDDSYDAVDRELIFPLLGKMPVDRWEIAESLYKQARLNAQFKLYPDVAHTITPAIRDEILAFLSKHPKMTGAE